MENAETVLVIILSVTLTIFLIVATVLVVTLIKLAKMLQNIAVKTGEIVDNVESATETFKKAAGPLAIGKFLMNIFEMVTKKGKG